MTRNASWVWQQLADGSSPAGLKTATVNKALLRPCQALPLSRSFQFLSALAPRNFFVKRRYVGGWATRGAALRSVCAATFCFWPLLPRWNYGRSRGELSRRGVMVDEWDEEKLIAVVISIFIIHRSSLFSPLAGLLSARSKIFSRGAKDQKSEHPSRFSELQSGCRLELRRLNAAAAPRTFGHNARTNEGKSRNRCSHKVLGCHVRARSSLGGHAK